MGRDAYGQLGDNKFGESANADKPVEVKELYEPVNAISAGATHSLALLRSGWIAAWGATNRVSLAMARKAATTSRSSRRS
jgi:alpha-tubulin suppressor-like RCC1 family protein